MTGAVGRADDDHVPVSRCAPATAAFADVDVRCDWTTTATISATPPPPRRPRRRRSCAAGAPPRPGRRPRRRASRRSGAGPRPASIPAVPSAGTRQLLLLRRTGRGRRGPAATAASVRGRGRRRAGRRPGRSRRVGGLAGGDRPPLPKQPQSICRPAGPGRRDRGDVTTSSTAAAIAAVRTKTPASSARPTAISRTGRPNARRYQRLGQQPVGAHGPHGGSGIGQLQYARRRRRPRRGQRAAGRQPRAAAASSSTLHAHSRLRGSRSSRKPAVMPERRMPKAPGE